ncbi:MAG: alpha/beta hydrolase [Rhizobiaceae bacterium]
MSDTGSGPALLFLPGSYSTKEAWKGVQAALQGSYRVISTSLPGYGATPEIRSDLVADMALMQEFVAHVVGRIGEPVHLIGHSFGGLTALASTLSGAVEPLSVITFEGNPIYSLPQQGEFVWKHQVLEVGEKFEQAYERGDADAAALIIDYWGHEGFFAAMPETVRNFCRATTYTNVLDWRAAAGFTPRVSEFSSIDVPSSLVRGELANDAIVEITGLLSQIMPSATQHIVPSAGHFLISTHAEQCAAIIDDHMAGFYSG